MFDVLVDPGGFGRRLCHLLGQSHADAAGEPPDGVVFIEIDGDVDLARAPGVASFKTDQMIGKVIGNLRFQVIGVKHGACVQKKGEGNQKRFFYLGGAAAVSYTHLV